MFAILFGVHLPYPNKWLLTYTGLCVCVAVVEVNVVDTSGSKKVDDVTFPRPDPTRRSSLTAGGNSIRLTGDTIRQLGADGQSSRISPCHCLDTDDIVFIGTDFYE